MVKQAEFQEKDKEELNKVEKKILNLALSGTKINQDNYQLEYSAHNSLKNDLMIDKAFEITGGQISYRDTNMQMIAMRSVAEMTLNKRKIIELLQERMPDINIGELLDDTYCINQEMVTRQNNKGNQIGRNINLLISDYGYSLNDAVSAQILRNIENLNDEQLINVISKGVNSQEISSLLIKTRENDERIQVSKRKSIDTKYIVEAIVEGYNWRKDGKEISQKEKAVLIKAVLNRNLLDKDNPVYLSSLIQSMEQIGFDKQEIYGMIINLGVNDRGLKEAGYSYTSLLNNVNSVRETIKDYMLNINTTVTEETITKALSENLSEAEQKKIMLELEELGIDFDFLNQKDIRNIYFAKKIVDDYNFGDRINVDEKAALIKSILDNSKLHNRSHAYLTTLIQNFEQIGLSRQETFGTILNLGIYGTVLEEVGYSYTNLLLNANNSCESIRQYKNKIRTKVSEEAIDIATARNVSEAEENKIRSELVQLGMDDEFVEAKDIRNLFEAKRIVDKFDFGRKISGEEKASLIIAMINKSDFNKKRTKFLINLMQTLEPIGLSTQEMYGMLINLGVNGKVIKEAGYNYNNLIRNQNNACQT